MNHQELSELFEKLVKNQCSEEEAERIVEVLADGSNEGLLQALIKHELKRPLPDNADDQANERLKNKLDLRLEQILRAAAPAQKTIPARTWNRRARYAAAAVLLSLSVATWLLVRKPAPSPAVVAKPVTQPIIAGSNKAILTLNDGRKIDLDETSPGDIATQSNTVVKKLAGGVLVYDKDTKPQQGKSALPEFNTVTIPKGGQYQVVLPDGSKVWLNAASSLKYPTQFNSSERLVELTGEGYFEIAGIPRQPFIVISNHQRIEVLGTMFNINAYVEEAAVKTTLLNGAVRVSAIAGNSPGQLISPRTLLPGQQSELSGEEIKISEGNIEAALAWKNGKFQFEHEDIRVVMRKIARWYDVEVDYDGNMKGKVFSGTISKYESLNEVLKMLQLTETVSFTIKGRKIIVS
ncbi:DUF4974 domain-containing protein [Flavitalea sp. BT771]|uniref:FecR family protein n=1 Tax=Flavitalea sp. BT771 TaxID=3063329 RepID=UPI0026E2FAF5|nr:FecR family protein [Flavitalea sp. BT771]MDO6429916.1 DUF4974 domain-containing protein [Flavitalea sp. BT771]MDV6217956.1 DUF4974 domain-containing protein [Flavitalea sp. BT771]